MKIINAGISILISRDHTEIELIDKTSSTTFATIRLTPEQLSSALSRLSHTPCEVIVTGLDKLNKKLEIGKHSFEIPPLSYKEKHDNITVYEYALKSCPEGWIPDNYFGGQNSFTQKDGQHYAHCTIRRWVDINEQLLTD